MGTLYIVATPIGNLEDITLRALRILSEVYTVIAEDTRVTKKLLTKHGIEAVIMSYHTHNHDAVKEKIINKLYRGHSVALVTDAGTPGVSDPGNRLVAEAVAHGIPVVPIPGASAVTTLLSVAGINTSTYTFLGFIPTKKGRETFFRSLVHTDIPQVFFESKHRIMKTLTSLQESLPDTKRVLIGRELTKMHESLYRGTAKEILTYLQAHEDEQRGEYVLMIY